MEALKDWRSPQFEEDLAKLDRGGIAFEFLRRNARYQADYAKAMKRIAAGGEERSGAIARLSRRWGVTFPCQPIPAGSRCPSDLESPSLSGGAHRWPCSGRIRGEGSS